jgi:2-oxoglutarate-Fe(II)-dependent oxygenase superfamily protein
MSATPHQDLRHFVRVYDDALPATWCTRLLKGFDALSAHQARNGRELRAGLDDSAWTELNVTRHGDAPTTAFFRGRIDEALARYNADVQLQIPIPNSPAFADLVLKRYRPNSAERFQLHFDAINHLANRYVVLLWYLNDVERGGATRFPQLGLEVGARAGRLLMFPPYWMYQHEGLPPESGDKYILSTYLLFPATPA